MWPMLLDMTEEESVQSLRHLELEAYSSLVSALRAQGNLNQEKKKLLKETGIALNISNDRHKAEIRRAISDERLNTIAYHITGQLSSLEEWAQEGHRLVPLLPRVPPQTPYSIIADDASEAAIQYNKQLPLPANTERKRSTSSISPSASSNESGGKSQTFRVPDVPKDDFKKRKNHIGENNSLAQHLLSTKLSRIQQIYRQASKVSKHKYKENDETENQESIKPNLGQLPMQNKIQPLPVSSNLCPPKVNIIQNVSITQIPLESVLEEKVVKGTPADALPASENPIPVPKNINMKPNPINFLRHAASSNVKDDINHTEPIVKINANKTLNKKLIVVSNAPTITTNSILQKTLSVPINKLTKLNLDKFKIVGSSQFPSTLVSNIANQSAPPKLVTLKGATGKKLISFSQLQMLNSKGLKMVPYSGKVFDKSITLKNPIKKALISVNSISSEASRNPNSRMETISIDTDEIDDSTEQEESAEDSDVKLCESDESIEEIDMKLDETTEGNSSLEESDDNDTSSDTNDEGTDNEEDCSITNEMEVDSYNAMESHIRQSDELLEECEIFHEELL